MKNVLTLALLASCAFGQQPKTFDTPEAAVQALIDATSKNDSHALAAILGSTAQGLLTSGDPQRDQAERSEFAQLANTKHSLEKSSMRANTMVLLVGDQRWPFPVPLIRTKDQWHFDPAAGSIEVRARRVGANELDAIEICAGYVEAQQAFAAGRRSGAATMEYARNIVSSPGQKDGLYAPGASPELVPEGFANAAVESPDPSGKTLPRLLFPRPPRARD